MGKNHKYKASPEYPFTVFGNDFDDNGTNDVVSANYSGDELLPVCGRKCTSEQMLFVAEKFSILGGRNGNFESVSTKSSGFFANADIRDMVGLNGDRELIFVANNNWRVQEFEM